MITYRITEKRTGRELGEGSGGTKAQALLELHRLALLSEDGGNLGAAVVALAADGRRLDFVDDGLREVPASARYRNLLGDVADVEFERLA